MASSTRQLDLEIVNGTIARLEEEIDARLKRVKNLKEVKVRIIRELNKEAK